MTDFFNLPSKAGQDTQNQYLSQIAQHLGVTAGNLQDAINMANQANQAAAEKITDLETRFQTLTAEQQQDAEVIDARDGETSLRARLDRDHAEFESHKAESVQQSGGVHGLIVEKGTWTPMLNPSQNIELDIQTGSYVRIGDIVHCFMDIQIGNMGSWSGTQVAVIRGLPFAVKNSAPNSVAEYSKINLPVNGKDMFLILEFNTMYLRSNRGSVDGSAVSYVASHFGVGSRIRTSFSYQI